MSVNHLALSGSIEDVRCLINEPNLTKHKHRNRSNSTGMLSLPSMANSSQVSLPAFVDEAPPIVVYDRHDFYYAVCKKTHEGGKCECGDTDEMTEFEKFHTKRWDECYEKCIMNYKLNLMYKLLTGKYKLTAQLNCERGQLRRKPNHFRHVSAKFDRLRFNYNKIPRKEMLVDLRCTDDPITKEPLDRHLLIVNASPIERGHSLALASVNRCHNQVATQTSIRLMTDLCLLSRSLRFHVLFNSLLAFASVNHLHFHTLTWPYSAPIIKLPVRKLYKLVHYLRAPEEWMVPAYVIQLTKPDEREEFIKTVYAVTHYLNKQDTAHNMFWARAPRLQRLKDDGSLPDKLPLFRHDPHFITAYIFPRKSVPGAKPLTKFSPAASELAGNLLIYSNRFFHTLSETAVLRIIEEECALPSVLLTQLTDGLIQYLQKGIYNPIPMDSSFDRLDVSRSGSRYDEDGSFT